MLYFTRPTLVTLTAPTCGGKNYLLEALIEKYGFNRIVSTTDRAPRAGEIHGLHYDFISTAASMDTEAAGDFAELVTYNGVRYGVTNQEMAAKMSSDRPPIVILEPSGLNMYRKYCATAGWGLFSIFISTPEPVRIARLASRTAADVLSVIASAPAHTGAHAAVEKVLRQNNARLAAIVDLERAWSQTNSWDAVVDGEDLQKALHCVELGIHNFNSLRKQALYN